MFRIRRLAALSLAVLVGVARAEPESATEIRYVLSFPQPEHRWMQVEATFDDPPPTLQVRMSRSSPGRYALHQFAKDLFDVQAVDETGAALRVDRPNPHEWDIVSGDTPVHVTYKVFGDHLDGTYLAIDSTHAHINMPAALVWARGLEDRPARITFTQPSGKRWRVATQLMPTADPLVFTAPNLQYLMDSPAEFGDFTLREFRVAGASPTFRVALHDGGVGADLDRFVADVRNIVAEERSIFGEYPDYETGTYIFIIDALPHARNDGMEHRNSTVVTSSRSIRNPRDRQGLLGAVAHEFFHCWNVERIRPAGLEPFNFDEANVSPELWLAEGVTSYYDSLVLQRAGLAALGDATSAFADLVNAVALGPGRRLGSVEDMSRMAPLVDAARSVDRMNAENTFLSYYTWGAALGLALDLSLRDRSDGAITLDDFMRAMWRIHGRPAAPGPGLVARPYRRDDVRDRLAEVAQDPQFAREFYRRFIAGREVADYARLLSRAGLVLGRRSPRQAWLDDVTLEFSNTGARVASATTFDSPLYAAGVDHDDEITSLDGQPVTSADRLATVLKRHKPGDRIPLVFTRRGARVEATVTLAEDPRMEVATKEGTGALLTDAERKFREGWLRSPDH
ncbi:MAG: M61 family metallopeptidase [Acidobacteria bacterium]|nr:M61 family metallopeptidase [Acidobacteriota bacterium]